MTPVEAAKFVKLVISAWPNTRVEEQTTDVWYAAGLNEVSWDDGGQAIKNLLKTKSFISLAEILTEVRRIRHDRLDRRVLPNPTPELVALAEDPVAYSVRTQAAIKHLADGYDLVQARPINGSGAQPSSEYERKRGVYRDPLRLAALEVRCPWSPCGALPNHGCTTASGKPLLGRGHDHRLVAAGLADWVEIRGVQRVVLHGQDLS